ncbi:MAG TPA: hypothetical protein PKD57_13855 [Saprospiraceae bacterium]|nr:hypothetical protein [Saprospiraceae bacterium]
MNDTTPSKLNTPPGNLDASESDELIVLYEGYTVPQAFYDIIRVQIEVALPCLIPDKNYTVKALCGKEFWGMLGNGERRMAGRCAAHMIVEGCMPLRFAESRHEYPKRYKLK